jgi:ABC-type sugar transport system substrate-binding protein
MMMRFTLGSATRRSAGLAVLTLFAATALASCSSSSGAAGGAGGAGVASAGSGKCADSKIAFLILDAANPWVGTLADGGKAEAEKRGAKIDVLNGALDTATQVSQLQQAVADGVDGILIETVEADGVVPAVQQANRAGIPVVAVNSGVGAGAEVVTFVGVDQKDYGRGLAKLAIQAKPGGGKVAIIRGVAGNPIEVDRTAGIKEVLAQNAGYQTVAEVTDSWNNDDNLAAVQDLLNKYPKGSLDVIIAEGPEVYVGAQYAASVGRNDVKFIAGDFPVQVRDAINKGTVYGTVLQDGAEQGQRGVDALCNWIEGKTDQVKRPTDFVTLPLVTKDNLSDYSTSWNW